MSLNEAQRVSEVIRARMKHDVMGRDEVIELALIALLSGGHMLLEDYPGSGKTTLAKALGEAISLGEHSMSRQIKAPFRRVQFTPDMLPSDIRAARTVKDFQAKLQHLVRKAAENGRNDWASTLSPRVKLSKHALKEL